MPCPTSLHCPASQYLWDVETSEPAPFWEEEHVTKVHQGHRNSVGGRIATALLTRSVGGFCAIQWDKGTSPEKKVGLDDG